MINLPTLRQLRYLVVLSEECHFGRAADACLVTQSTLSAGIKELEGLLGLQLFERTKRRVVPTPVGLDLVERAKRTLAEAEGLVEAARAAGEPLSGPLHIGVIPTISPFLVPRVVPALRSRFPALQPYLREDQTARLLERLEAGELDVLILAYPFDTPDAESQMFMEDPFWLALPKGHALASSAPLAPDEVPTEELLLLEDGHCLRDHALAACRLQGGRRHEGFRGTSLDTLVQMVASNLGLTLLPRMAVDSGLFAGVDMVLRPLSTDAAPRQIGLAWRATSARKEEFRTLAAALGEIVGNGPDPS